jgi:hypothetical protein
MLGAFANALSFRRRAVVALPATCTHNTTAPFCSQDAPRATEAAPRRPPQVLARAGWPARACHRRHRHSCAGRTHAALPPRDRCVNACPATSGRRCRRRQRQDGRTGAAVHARQTRVCAGPLTVARGAAAKATARRAQAERKWRHSEQRELALHQVTTANGPLAVQRRRWRWVLRCESAPHPRAAVAPAKPPWPPQSVKLLFHA